MTTVNLKLTAFNECVIPLRQMVCSLDTHVSDKRQLANNIFNRKQIMNKTCIGTQKINYIEKYGMIARIKQIGKIYEYINKNYLNIFSFNKKMIELLNVIYNKRDEYRISITNYRTTHKLSKSEKKIIKIAETQINTKSPNMSNEIGNVLNRIFIKDIALYITEYI